MPYKDYKKRLEAAAKSHRKAWLKTHPIPKMVEHHLKYKEIHGVDETKWMTASEHRKLHARLRREGKCNIPSKELAKISERARWRTEKWKARNRKRSNKYAHRYNKHFRYYVALGEPVSIIETITYNTKTNSIIFCSHIQSHEYRKKNYHRFFFVNGLESGTGLLEELVYNSKLNKINYSSHFYMKNNKKLPVVEVN